MQRQLITGAKRIVLKIGSSLVASPNLGLRHNLIQQLSHDIAELKNRQCEVVLVSSGAIVAGIEKLGLKSYPQSIPLKQAAAATGQSHLVHAYEKCFQEAGQKVAQILLTHQDLTDRKRFLNARNTLTALIEMGVIPIINENDTVSVEEIRFGDNDTLAGQVAHLVDADLFVILSDVDGLYTKDPRENPKAELISEVEEITAEIEQSAGTSRSQKSRGGMITKIQAAKHVGQFGVPTLLMNGETPGLLTQVFGGKVQGTLILPQGRRLPSRKHWIAFTLRSKGQLILDDGAVEALQHHGKSLLPSGILDIKGVFYPGDPVSCVDTNGKEFAKGLVNVSSDSLAMIKGRKTKEIQKILGGKEYEEVIHRNNLALL